jgi:beta-glucosidase
MSHARRVPLRLAGVLVAVLAAAALVPLASATAALTPEQRADALLAQMTLDEKIAMLHGGGSCGYVGCIPANTRLGIPALHLQDGPVGAGDGFTGVTQLPAPVAGAASFDVAAMQQYGQVLGSEQWGKGTNVVLAPTVNIVRDPRWGRAFESFGEDPYLAGQVGAADILGIQGQGPLAQVKHYAVYNQETNRNSPADNAIVSDRAQREIYLPAFEAALRTGHAASAMCSYSLINGPYACENGPLQNGVLKGDLAFDGFITSDWGATHSTVPSANNGLDMEMPGGTFFGAALKTAVQNGQVSQATLDGHVRRILVQMFRLGLFDRAQTGNTGAVVTTPAHAATARQIAQEGAVLLKNTGPVLPIASTVHTLAVVGAGAGPDAMSQGGGSAGVNAPYLITPAQGLTARGGSAVTVRYAQGGPSSSGGLPAVSGSAITPSAGTGTGLFGQYFNNTTLSGTPVTSRVDPVIDAMWGGGSPAPGVNATNWSVKWTGTLHAPATGTYRFSLTSDDGSRLFVNGTQVIDNWFNQASTTRTGSISLSAGQSASVEVDYYQAGGASNATFGWEVPGQSAHDAAVQTARTSDLAVVVVNNFETEGSDLGSIDLPAAQNQLVTDVAAANPNTVVVVNSGSAVTMPWAGAVRGIVEAWYPGQEYGTALAGLLFGDANFSGRLPVTFPQRLSDVPAATAAQWPGQGGQVQYSEGVNVGYRWYDATGRTPLFPFGFGLSYTTFSYANLAVSTPDGAGNVAVAFDVTNTGTRAGAEVPQVYVGQPAAGEPPRSLRGFTRVTLTPGQTQRVTVTLDARSFQWWNNGWANAAGTNQVYVGASSRDIRLTGQVTIGGGGGHTVLPRTGWVATASSSGGGDVPARMLDGNAATRWSTGVPMANGQTVTLDMAATRTFSQLTMDSAGSASDYARGYQVFTSADGVNWGSPIATGAGTNALVTVGFAARSARYLRIVQTGSSASWWSIAELNVYT